MSTQILNGVVVCTHDPPLLHCKLCHLRGLVPWPPLGRTEPAPAGPCPFLGAATGGLVECETCEGRVRLKLFLCSHPMHGPETDPGRCRRCERLPVPGA